MIQNLKNRHKTINVGDRFSISHRSELNNQTYCFYSFPFCLFEYHHCAGCIHVARMPSYINLTFYMHILLHADRDVVPSELTSVTSLDAAAALICRLGCFTELEQSKALAKVPTDLDMTKN